MVAYRHLTNTFHLTLKMTSAQVVETSVTNNSLSGDYSNPDDHNQPTVAYFVTNIEILVLTQSHVDINLSL